MKPHSIANDLNNFGAIQAYSIGAMTSSTKPAPYEKQHSAKKPKRCPVEVEFCLDCPKTDCTYDRSY